MSFKVEKIRISKNTCTITSMWLSLYYFNIFYSFGVECRSCSLSMDRKSWDVKAEYTGLLFDKLCLFKFEVSFTFYSCNILQLIN